MKYYLFSIDINFHVGTMNKYSRTDYKDFLYQLRDKLADYNVATVFSLSQVHYSELCRKNCDLQKAIASYHIHGHMIGFDLQEMQNACKKIDDYSHSFSKNWNSKVTKIRDYDEKSSEFIWKKYECYSKHKYFFYQRVQSGKNNVIISNIDSIKKARDFDRFLLSDKHTMINERIAFRDEKEFQMWIKKTRLVEENLNCLDDYLLFSKVTNSFLLSLVSLRKNAKDIEADTRNIDMQIADMAEMALEKMKSVIDFALLHNSETILSDKQEAV